MVQAVLQELQVQAVAQVHQVHTGTVGSSQELLVLQVHHKQVEQVVLQVL
jgi:hypothetical protein